MNLKPQLQFALVLVVLLAIGAAAYLLQNYRHPGPTAQSSRPTSTYSPPPSRIAHLFIIVEENKPYPEVIGSTNAPFINSLATKYGLATNYHSVASPSLPNYLALTSGSTNGVTDDCNPPAGCKLNARNIADELEQSHVTWKQYAEGMPSPCYAQNAGKYATKHVPFLYYTDILDNANRCHAHVVPLTQLSGDLTSASKTPGFAFITPDLCHDGHDCPVSAADAWLSQTVPQILSSPAFTSQNSLLVIVWDEADSQGNHIPAVLAGPAAKPGHQDAASYDHYSLLKTIEANWSLKPLTSADARASALASFLN